MTDITEPPVGQGPESSGSEILMKQLREAHLQSGLEAIEYALRGVGEARGPVAETAETSSDTVAGSEVSDLNRQAESSRRAIEDIHKRGDLGLGQVIKLVRPSGKPRVITDMPPDPNHTATVTSMEDIHRITEMQFGHYGNWDGSDTPKCS
jgi:hypothetical protein